MKMGLIARADFRTISARTLASAVIIAATFMLPSLVAQSLSSLDFRGDCSYVRGTPTSPGETKLRDDGKTVELVAHGTEFGHHCGEDQGRFAFTVLEGNFDVVVQIEHVTNHGAKQFYSDKRTLAKAGIMAREGNQPADRYVAIWAESNDGHGADAFQFDLRKVAGAWLGNQAKDCRRPHECEEACGFVYGYVNHERPQPEFFERQYPHVWLRLKREGKIFNAMISKDGETWHRTSTPSHQIEFPEKLFVGVALSAAAEGHFNARAEAVFKNIKGLR
ncbi:MAG: hypothetical protein EHM23_14555 [Acidobacteria bacterium]|nr:MAG: hypothetical protein EHM23_14555 [Acidobacteriota bacterium]